MIESIPLYPLAAVVFLGAGVLFVLQMARHLRVFAAAQSSVVNDHAEARIAWMGCTDGTERPRLERVSPLLHLDTRTQTPCHVDTETHARALCGDRTVVAIAGTTCQSVESDGLDVVTACGPASDAVLLID